MQLRVRSKEDFYSGLMFLGFGLLAIIVARDYPMGSAMRMGPGYFPTYLGAIAMLFGIVIAFRALRVDGPDVQGWAWRPLILLMGAFALFGILMEEVEAGFVPSIATVLVVASLAGRDFKVIEVVVLTIGLTAGAVGLFIYGLELPYSLFWWY